MERAYLAICIGHFREPMGGKTRPSAATPLTGKKMAIREKAGGGR